MLKDRNWSQKDIQTNAYTSPNNFDAAYNSQNNVHFNAVLLQSMQNNKNMMPGLKKNQKSYD
jgi:hypothetical protein